jgi:hypothetical protein
MKCPIDGTDLAMTDRQGIEIDYCPQCRGVWLDRGELDKIIERAAADMPGPVAARPAPRYDERHDRHQQGGPYHGKKRKSLLGEIFDF